MNDPSSVRRQLTIKCNVVKRLLKEHTLYQSEAVAQQIEADNAKADPDADEVAWRVKNTGNLLSEANKMVDDSAQRLGKAVAELRNLVVAVKSDPAFAEDEELLKAESMLEEASV